MPVYDFKCKKCGHEQTELILTDKDVPKCSLCGRSMVKIMSASNFILKGDNWSKDGYGLRKSKKENANQ